jgi:hypothetical protein
MSQIFPVSIRRTNAHHASAVGETGLAVPIHAWVQAGRHEGIGSKRRRCQGEWRSACGGRTVIGTFADPSGGAAGSARARQDEGEQRHVEDGEQPDIDEIGAAPSTVLEQGDGSRASLVPLHRDYDSLWLRLALP